MTTSHTSPSAETADPHERRGGSRWLRSRAVWIVLALMLAAGAAGWVWRTARESEWRPAPDPRGATTSAAPASESDVRQLCSHCHVFPEPETLPVAAWRQLIPQMAELHGYGVNMRRRPDPGAVVAWYEERAPRELLLPEDEAALLPDPFQARIHPLTGVEFLDSSFVSHVHFADLLPDAGLELVVCDMHDGRVLLGSPWLPDGALTPIAAVPHPAHCEPFDLDQDGRTDLLVANLGSFLPLDHNLGSVEWLRQTADGVFERRTLFDNLGRVADVRPADLDGDGDTDLVVAEFGFQSTGHVLVLRNVSSDPREPEFEAEFIDGRSGAINVEVVDLDGDGRLDVLALISQQHEMVNAYLNRGDGRFEARELYRAPGPSWGSSGMQLVDFDQDGDPDLLLANGDTLDDGRLKPYHGLTWLENHGSLSFEPHFLCRFYGAHRAEAADLDGDGDMDVVACAFASPEDGTGQSPQISRETGVLWLEQLPTGRFQRHVLETNGLMYPTLHAADVDGDGDVDVAVGNAVLSGAGRAPTAWGLLWENTVAGSNVD